jgi:hypothetical protein
LRRVNLDAREALAAAPPDDLLAVDEALDGSGSRPISSMW